jgi:outer membrane receptor protein involved in Fe transport
VTTKSKQLGLYIQDDWNVTDKLQLNLGIRWDYEEIPSYVDHVTPPEVVAALTGPGTNPAITPTYAEQLALGGVDLADYISTGNNRKADKDNWAPRLGFSYDLGDDERHVIFGGAGRSYDRNLYDYMGLEQVKSALSGYTIQFSDTTGCTPTPGSCVAWDPSFLNGTDVLAGLVTSNVRNGEIDLLNNDLVTPYSDQFSLGMRNKIGEWNTSATIAYIHSKEGFVFTLGNRYPNGDFFQGGSQPWGHSPPGFGALIIGNNGIETKTKQLLLSADKPYTKESGWGVSAAYTFSDATGNRGGDEHYAFDAATIEQYPFIDLKAVPKHRLVLTGIYDLPWNITASAKLTLATPPPINEIVGSPYFSPPRAVAIDAPGTLGTKQLDLSLSKDFLVTEDVTVQVRGDLINATDADNFSGYTTVFGDGVTYNPQASVNRYGTQYTPPRTLFMSVRVIW